MSQVRKLRSEAIQFLVTVMTVAPLSYLLALAVKSAFYKSLRLNLRLIPPSSPPL
ncbi:TPA: hypothetical protein JAJ90_002636 [Corynebacterium striatum]|nr:hypothetical protein [Corynebacterium striatum]HAT6419961.1 hypothetical protein [Corynebacterium striatum]HAT6434710.1 hypothetical protein [Corynebacterium striatum]HAT6480624.1 hypothetical protein [Corynebacterium striatum]HAT6485768.1 hypothetical protein [Corynebacterium striatum]